MLCFTHTHTHTHRFVASYVQNSFKINKHNLFFELTIFEPSNFKKNKNILKFNQNLFKRKI